jgi:hypothetical protein
MLARTTNPYIQFLRNKYPMFIVVDVIPGSVKPEDLQRVIYENDMIEIIFKQKGKQYLAVLDSNKGQQVIMKLKREISKREEYLDRVENWECRNTDDVFDMAMQFRLIESRMTDNEREFREKSLTKLCHSEVTSSLLRPLSNTLSMVEEKYNA